MRLLALSVVPSLLLLGCDLGLGDGCESDEPSTAAVWASIPEGGPEPRLEEQRSVFVQYVVDRGASCQGDLAGNCTCVDGSGGSPDEFEVVEASCDDGLCDVVGIGPYVVYGRDITLVPHAAVVTLRVTLAPIAATEHDAPEATAAIVIATE